MRARARGATPTQRGAPGSRPGAPGNRPGAPERAAGSRERAARRRERRTVATSLLLLVVAASVSVPPVASGRHTVGATPAASGLQVRPADPADPGDPDQLSDLVAPTRLPVLTSAAREHAQQQQQQHHHSASLSWAPAVPVPLRRVLLRMERSLSAEGKRQRSGKKKGGGGGGGRSCQLRTVEVTVKELGLGYDSEETLRFKYCGGNCHMDRNMYHIALGHLLKAKKSGLVASRSSAQPCCRPVGFEGVSFLDSKHDWKTVENISANGCQCLH